jgi:hypothetical protein
MMLNLYVRLAKTSPQLGGLSDKSLCRNYQMTMLFATGSPPRIPMIPHIKPISRPAGRFRLQGRRVGTATICELNRDLLRPEPHRRRSGGRRD